MTFFFDWSVYEKFELNGTPYIAMNRLGRFRSHLRDAKHQSGFLIRIDNCITTTVYFTTVYYDGLDKIESEFFESVLVLGGRVVHD